MSKMMLLSAAAAALLYCGVCTAQDAQAPYQRTDRAPQRAGVISTDKLTSKQKDAQEKVQNKVTVSARVVAAPVPEYKGEWKQSQTKAVDNWIEVRVAFVTEPVSVGPSDKKYVEENKAKTTFDDWIDSLTVHVEMFAPEASVQYRYDSKGELDKKENPDRNYPRRYDLYLSGAAIYEDIARDGAEHSVVMYVPARKIARHAPGLEKAAEGKAYDKMAVVATLYDDAGSEIGRGMYVPDKVRTAIVAKTTANGRKNYYYGFGGTSGKTMSAQFGKPQSDEFYDFMRNVKNEKVGAPTLIKLENALRAWGTPFDLILVDPASVASKKKGALYEQVRPTLKTAPAAVNANKQDADKNNAEADEAENQE